MGELSGTGIAAIVCGSLSLCLGCGAFLYLLFVLLILSAILLVAAVYMGWTILPYILLLVAASLAIAAGAKTSNKGLWIASLVLSAITVAGFVAVIAIVSFWGNRNGNTLHFSLGLAVLFILPIVFAVVLVILSAVGVCQADAERVKQEQRRGRAAGQPMTVVVAAPPPQASGPPQYASNPPQYNKY